MKRAFINGEITIAELLKTAGFATAHYGKWHIDGSRPEKHGYDERDGETGNGDAAPFKDPNPVDIFGMAGRAGAFMAKSHEAQRPFFIQMSFHALHYPENARAQTVASVRERLDGANERQIGRIAIAEDLSADLSESNDLSKKNLTQTEALDQRPENYLMEIGAKMPT